MAGPFRYAAFISYSSKDAAFARRLHRALEGYVIPSSLGKFNLVSGGKPNRIYPVFRDREELSAGPLPEQIAANLKASASLVVVCSPNSAASPWVQSEIEQFIAQGREEKIFTIIPDTAPLWDESGEDATQACFPPALGGETLGSAKLTPLAADARKGKDGFRNAWLKIVAGMIGVSPGRILDRDRQRHRVSAFRAAAVWALVLIGLGYAYSQRGTIEPLYFALTKYRPYAQRNSREALSRVLPGTTFQDCREDSTDCPAMVVIPQGRFTMGSPPYDPNSSDDEKPRRRIQIARFAVSQHEVTFADWKACLQSDGCNGYSPNNQGWPGDDRPVVNVSWEDAQLYAAWLTRVTGHKYRLLTEAEWEYSARAGSTAQSWAIAPPICEPKASNGAVFSGCPQKTTWPVGSFRANAFGLYDMEGNVGEWVEDCYALYDPTKSDGAAVQADIPPCTQRVTRGGAWNSRAGLLRSAKRTGTHPALRVYALGFRVASTL